MRPDTVAPIRFHLVGIAVICLLGVVIYSNAIRTPFAFDDLRNIQNNRAVHLKKLSVKGLVTAARESYSWRRPVANISFALNYYFAGDAVAAYHVVNVVVHLLTSGLVYCLGLVTLRQLACTSDRVASGLGLGAAPIAVVSLFAGLFFLSHPLQTQAVTYTVQRMTSMAAMFYLLSLLLYIQGRRASGTARRWTLWLCGIVSWILALGSKEIAATLPLIVLMYEWYFFRDLSRRWLRHRIGYVLLAFGVLGLVAFSYMNEQILDFSIRDFSMWERVHTQFRVVVFYLSLLLFPHPSRLNLLHHIATSDSHSVNARTLLSMAAIAGLFGLALVRARADRLLSFGILWFLIHLVIESSVLRLEMIFEHRVYLPSVAVMLLVSITLRRILVSIRGGLVGVGILITLLFAVGTHRRNMDWQDSFTNWADVAAKNPRSHRAHSTLGTIYQEQGAIDAAEASYHRAIEVNPRYAEAYYNLATSVRSRGEFDAATTHLLRAIDLDPQYALAHHNYAEILVIRGRLDDGIERYRIALECDPNLAIAHNNLALGLRSKGMVSETLFHLRRAIELSPDYAAAHYNLGDTLSVDGTLEEAIHHYRLALKADPQMAEARRELDKALQLLAEQQTGEGE